MGDQTFALSHASVLVRFLRLVRSALPLIAIGTVAAQTTAPVRRVSPVVRIGDRPGAAYELAPLRCCLVATPDGGVVVSQRDRGELRHFDSTGRHVRTVGRVGTGPGEFRDIDAIRAVGDTTLVFDGTLRRTSRFTRASGAVTWSFVETPAAHAVFHGTMRGGARLFVQAPPARDLLGKPREGLLILEDSATRKALLTRTVAIGTAALVFEGNGVSTVRMDMVHRFLSQDALYGISPSGRTLVLIDRRVKPDQKSLEVELRDERGQLKRRFTIARAPIAVDRAAVDRELSRVAQNAVRLKAGGFTNLSSAKSHMEQQLRLPRTFPMAAGLIVENDSSIWIAQPGGWRAREPLATSGATLTPGVIWERYDDAGRLRDRVQVPAAVDLMSISGTSFWGTAEDADGVPLVVRLK